MPEVADSQMVITVDHLILLYKWSHLM